MANFSLDKTVVLMSVMHCIAERVDQRAPVQVSENERGRKPFRLSASMWQ